MLNLTKITPSHQVPNIGDMFIDRSNDRTYLTTKISSNELRDYCWYGLKSKWFINIEVHCGYLF